MRAEASIQNRQYSQYSMIQDQVINRVSGLIPHQELQTEITNRVLLNLLQSEISVNNVDAWIERKTYQYLELCMQELWQSAYKHARQMNMEKEEAEDLAQNTIIALLQIKEPIQYPRAWIRATVSNQASSLIRGKQRNSKLQNHLKVEQTTPLPTTKYDDDLDTKLSPELLKKYLSKEDYTELLSMHSYPSLKAYAAAKGISYSGARTLKCKIVTNLKAKYYIKQGWSATRTILDFQKLANINRFVEVITRHAVKDDFSSVYHYASPELIPDLKDSLHGFTEVSKWEITLSSKYDYDLCLLDAANPKKPLAAFISIALNKANYIRIKQCRRASAVYHIPVDKLGPLPVDKGRCLLSLNQILNYLH